MSVGLGSITVWRVQPATILLVGLDACVHNSLGRLTALASVKEGAI